MERFILKKLLDWKNSPYRKPLILKGVRQVGKTWILKEFGGRCYENTAYFNFDEMKKIQPTLTSTKTKNINNFLKQPRMWTGFYKTLCWQAVKRYCQKRPSSSLTRYRTARKSSTP